MRTMAIAFFLGLMVTGNALADITNEQLVGTWYSQSEHDGEMMKWLIKREGDKSYVGLFLICEGKNLSWVQKERGQWLYQDDILNTVVVAFENMNGPKDSEIGKKSHYEQAILKGDTLSYKQYQSDNVYEFNRVEDGYQVSCP